MGDAANPDTDLLLVADALVLLGAAVENATGRGVALEPGLANLELAATLDGTDAVAASSVLRHDELHF